MYNYIVIFLEGLIKLNQGVLQSYKIVSQYNSVKSVDLVSLTCGLKGLREDFTRAKRQEIEMDISLSTCL